MGCIHSNAMCFRMRFPGWRASHSQPVCIIRAVCPGQLLLAALNSRAPVWPACNRGYPASVSMHKDGLDQRAGQVRTGFQSPGGQLPRPPALESVLRPCTLAEQPRCQGWHPGCGIDVMSAFIRFIPRMRRCKPLPTTLHWAADRLAQRPGPTPHAHAARTGPSSAQPSIHAKRRR